MPHVPRLSVFVLALAAASGCRSTTVREGIWKLSIDAIDRESRLTAPIPDREARLSVDWLEENATIGSANVSGNEVVVLTMLDEKDESGFPKLKGIVHSDGKRIDFRCADPEWVFNMRGDIQDERTMGGAAFQARHREFRSVELEGRWSLVWVRD